MNEPVLDFLSRRASVPSRLLAEPGPNPEQLARILGGALRVPDHGRLAPWRFLLIDRQQGAQLGQWLVGRLLERDPEATEAAQEKERGRFQRTPITVALVASPVAGHKVPVSEQLLSAGCVGMMLLLLAEAEGFGAQWLTGWPAHDAEAWRQLGLADGESIAGFFYIGTAQERAPDRPRPGLEERLTHWSATGND